jgi:hypothetical protein
MSTVDEERGDDRVVLTHSRFASAILLRPFRVNKAKKGETTPQLSEYEQQVELKRRLKSMLENEQLIPRVSATGMGSGALEIKPPMSGR